MEAKPEFGSNFNARHSLIARKIVRLLSESSRDSVSELALKLGLSRFTAKKWLKEVERTLGLHYTIEVNESALRILNQHLIYVRFDSEPDYAKISTMLQKSYMPQLAVSFKDKPAMFIYAISRSSREYAKWDKSMQILLSEYGVYWRPSEILHRQLGFFPLRDVLIETLDIPAEYKGILRLLNSNARMSFREMSHRLNMHFNTVAYNFNKLVKLGYVRRFTTVMDMPEDVTLMSFFASYRPREGYETSSAAARKAFMDDDENSLISRYIICAPLIGSYDFFTTGVFDTPKVAYKNDILYHKSIFKKHGIKIRYGVIDKVLFGRLPIRSIDTNKEYDKIIWDVQA